MSKNQGNYYGEPQKPNGGSTGRDKNNQSPVDSKFQQQVNNKGPSNATTNSTNANQVATNNKAANATPQKDGSNKSNNNIPNSSRTEESKVNQSPTLNLNQTSPRKLDNMSALDHTSAVENNGDMIANPTQKDDLNTVALKLKNQNEKLRTQLRELSLKLATTLDKVRKNNEKKKNKGKQIKPEDPLFKELEESSKQVNLYKNELQVLKGRLGANQTEIRIQNLENKIKERDRKIEKLVFENSNHDRVRRDQEKDLDQFQKTYDYYGKMKEYDNDLKTLRQQLRDIADQRRNNEIQFKKQQEWLVTLESRYRDACDKLGVSSSLNFTKAEIANNLPGLPNSPRGKYKKKPDGPPLITPDGKYFGYPADDEDHRDAVLEVELIELINLKMSQQNFDKLKQDCRTLKDQFAQQEKQCKQNHDEVSTKLRSLEHQKKGLEDSVKERETETNILQHRLSEFRRITRLANAQSPKPNMERSMGGNMQQVHQ